MPSVVLKERPELRATVGGKPVGEAPPASGGVGPQGFPPPPPPPPPPPVPLTVVSVTTEAFYGNNALKVEVDRQFKLLTYPIDWSTDGPAVTAWGLDANLGANQFYVLLNGPFATELTIPPGVTSMAADDDGGAIVAGTYPVT